MENINIIALSKEGNITLTSNNNDVNILSATETETTVNSKTETHWGGIELNHTNSSIGIDAVVNRETNTTTTNIQTAKSSNITTGNNLTINSNHNLNIVSSNLLA